MCRSCGCRMFEDDMGSADTIITQTLEKSAKAAGQTLKEFSQDLHEAMHRGQGHGGINHQALELAAKAMDQQTAEAMREVHYSLHADGHRHPDEPLEPA